MTDSTYHLTETVQWTTLLIAFLAVGVIFIGVKSICDDVRDRWSIDDANDSIDELTGDYCTGRDQHGVAERDAMVSLRGAR